jgi:hypothetical protein
MGYESAIRKVLKLIEPILHNAKQLQHVSLSWHVTIFILLFPV